MEERLQASASLREVLNKANIETVEELIYADLRRMGWSKSDAFYAAFGRIYRSYSMTQQRKLMLEYESNPHIVARINGSGEIGSGTMPLDELAKQTSKEKILSDLLVARQRYKSGTKEWTDLTKAIADYAKIKQDDIKTDERPIRYFLPVHYPTKCQDCLVYQKKMKKND